MGLFGWTKLELVLIFAYIGYIAIRIALGKATGLRLLFTPVSMLVVFGTMIFLCGTDEEEKRPLAPSNHQALLIY